MLKDNKGITLATLVITIIVLGILASVATVSGMGALDYMNFNNARTQFQTMQSHVNSWYEEYKTIDTEQRTEWLSKYGEDIETSYLDDNLVANTLNEGTGSNNADGYKYFSKEHIKNKLDIEGISYDFLINISTNTVLLYGGIEYQDKMRYSAEDFGINMVKTEQISGDIEFETVTQDNNIIIYDIQFPNNMIISKYIIKYKLSTESTWNTLTSDKMFEYTYKDDTGTTITDKNAWIIGDLNVGSSYNVKIITESKEIISQEKNIEVK